MIGTIDSLKGIFLKLKYPDKLIDSAINRVYHPPDLIYTPSDSPIRIIMPYKDQKSADVCDTNYIGYTRHHLHQRDEEHKHSLIGKHLKDEHNVRPSNLRENFTILKKCRSKLECLIFEMLYIRKKTEHLSGLDSRETFCLNLNTR